MRVTIDQSVTSGAHLTIDGLAPPGPVEVDLAKQVLRPAWRFELGQSTVDRDDVVHEDAMDDLVGQECGRIDWGLDSERFDDIAGERLADAGIVEHPIEVGGVPQCRIAHRRCCRRVVFCLAQRCRQQQISAAMDRVEPAEAGPRRFFRYGILSSFEERVASALFLQKGRKASPQLFQRGRGPGGDDALSEPRKLWHARGSYGECRAKLIPKGLDIKMRRATLDADLLAVVTNLSRVTGRAGEADPLALPVLLRCKIELADREADRKTERVRCARQVSEKPEPLEVIGGGKQRIPRGLLQRDEPLVGHEHRALTDVVPPFGRVMAPSLVEIGRFEARLCWVAW